MSALRTVGFLVAAPFLLILVALCIAFMPEDKNAGYKRRID